MCSFNNCEIIMDQICEIFGIGLQARIELGRGGGGGGAGTTIAELLRIRMDGVDRSSMRRKSLKERLGLKGMACCGAATLGIGPTTVSIRDEDKDAAGPLVPEIEPIDETPNGTSSQCVQQSPAATKGMNLAAALALERQFRASLDSDSGGATVSPSPSPSPERPNSNGTAGTAPGTPTRVSLMRLLEEADGYCGGMKKEDHEEGMGCDPVCCVCMGRKKGAAFIPCGHTFCRVCSRELWLNRGSCPLCNRLILEFLDIY